MGASGSGKTTLLHGISTIDPVSAGAIYLDGEDITRLPPKALARFRRENLGFVFQDFQLLDTLTIGENIALALTIRRADPRTIDPQVGHGRTLNIGDILDKYPYQVSGGRSSGAPAPGPSSTTPNWSWPTNPPAPWTATRPRCSWPPWRTCTASWGPPSSW